MPQLTLTLTDDQDSRLRAAVRDRYGMDFPPTDEEVVRYFMAVANDLVRAFEVGVGRTLPEGWSFLAPAPANVELEATRTLQRRLDAFAQLREYDGILSLCNYRGSSDPTFASEAEVGCQARDDVWGWARQRRAEILAGLRPMPATIAEALEGSPEPTWSA